MKPWSNTDIYRHDTGTYGPTLRLNLRAIKDLLRRDDIPGFDDLTKKDKDEIQRRFEIYCEHGEPDFCQGRCPKPEKNISEIKPSIDHLPNKEALRIAAMKTLKIRKPCRPATRSIK